MLPSTKPLVTALPAFCLWNPSTAPLAPVPLLLYICRAWLKVAAPVKDAFAFTTSVFELLAPITALPIAAKALPAVMLTGALKNTGAEKLDVAWTVISWLLLVPSVALP